MSLEVSRARPPKGKPATRLQGKIKRPRPRSDHYDMESFKWREESRTELDDTLKVILRSSPHFFLGLELFLENLDEDPSGKARLWFTSDIPEFEDGRFQVYYDAAEGEVEVYRTEPDQWCRIHLEFPGSGVIKGTIHVPEDAKPLGME